MKKEPVFCYKIKKLIPGGDIEPGLTGLYVGVPDRQYKGKPIRVLYTYSVTDENGQLKFIQLEKIIEDWNRAERFRRFMDQWGRGAYTLGYFKVCEKLE
jgi:hypothetical protein